MSIHTKGLAAGLLMAVTVPMAHADENLLGYVTGAETLPANAQEAYLWVTQREGKGTGEYTAYDVEAEYEYGFTPKLTGSFAVNGMALDTSGLVIDGYLPGAQEFGLKTSGVEGKLKYMFLSPAKDAIGLAGRMSLEHSWVDPHSGRDKNTTSLEADLLLQKFFLDDQLVGLANFGVETTYADRKPIDNLPPGFDWPTDPEMEIELKTGFGASYRVAPNWFIGAETVYETEFETEVGQERWSWFAGPSIHYGGATWWATLTYMDQLEGGGETYPGQPDDLHLIEKTEHEIRFKLGYNF